MPKYQYKVLEIEDTLEKVAQYLNANGTSGWRASYIERRDEGGYRVLLELQN